MKKYSLLVFVLCFVGKTFCQSGFHYETINNKPIPLAGIVVPENIQKDFFANLQSLEMPKPGGEEYSAYLNNLKKQIKRKQAPESMEKGSVARPFVGANFEGNRFPSGLPNDNHLGVSNDGKIVSVVNSTVAVFDTAGKILKTWSFDAFADTLKIRSQKYDGRVLYDPNADRFIIVFLAGFNDSTNFAILAFSKTNDPLQGWNLYALTGNPLKDNTWSDFPVISITKDEMFLTLNAVEDNKSWQAGFRRDYIWQIDKNSAYTGASLQNKLYTNIKYNNRHIRNISTVRGGKPLQGPESWFISNRNFDKENDTFFLLKLAGKMNTPDTILSVQVLTSADKYGVSPDALEPLKDTLQTNDARVLDAFIENGTIQMVGNSVYFPSGRSGVFHGIISNLGSNPVLKLNLLGGNNIDYGYPSIAYAGKGPGLDDAVILFNYSSDTTIFVNSKKTYIYPGHAVVFYSAGNYSDTLVLQKGTDIIDMINGKDRWGDYSAIQTRYNHLGQLWGGATFGHKVKVGSGIGSTLYDALGTWISQIYAPANTAGIALTQTNVNSAKIYPNPVVGFEPFIFDFDIQEEAILSFSVFDARGNSIKNLLTTKVDEGKNRFSFNLGALAKGQYFLRVTEGSRQVLTKKIVVQ